mmetsp:Transcript_33134/g.69288  ORF Transcript_33134/g.69288 Transcript_33134/m.69288 type:complete len:249 (+) Transcript_33134:1899-2645(+)
MMWRGIARASQTWMCPMQGGLAMTASATKSSAYGSKGSRFDTAGQQDFMMLLIVLSFSSKSCGFLTSPRTVPPVWTIHWLSCFGSPSSGKNSMPLDTTVLRWTSWLARRTRWPRLFSSLAREQKGRTSPWVPTTRMQMFITGRSNSRKPSSPPPPFLEIVIVALAVGDGVEAGVLVPSVGAIFPSSSEKATIESGKSEDGQQVFDCCFSPIIGCFSSQECFGVFWCHLSVVCTKLACVVQSDLSHPAS